jgi:hypothetical protein
LKVNRLESASNVVLLTYLFPSRHKLDEPFSSGKCIRLIDGNDNAVVRYLSFPIGELSHFEWLIVKNQFGVLGRMGLICKKTNTN